MIEIHWPRCPKTEKALSPSQAADAVVVRAARLDVPPEVLSRYLDTLAPAEREQAARYRFDVHRNRFIAGRAILRAILGEFLNLDPRQVEFRYGPKGKPEVADGSVHFNLSHCQDLALVALTQIGPVGVDVEQVRRLDDQEDLVKRFFSARENAAFQALPDAEKPSAFFNLWTRKEAWLKATGLGIGGGLNRVEVSFLSREPARLLALPAQYGSAQDWSLFALEPAAGFAGALALAGNRPVTLKQFAFE